tara:strand:+ start:28206 stop:29336 length:1131 start_codon:yes stop_codon:yes gene_type:complete
MIHLFKKIYVTTDNIIDPNFDRIVVSQSNGFNLLEDLQKILSGQLIAYGLEWNDILGKDKTFKDATTLFDELAAKCDSTNKRIVVYCDSAAFQFIMSTWYKFILKTPKVDSVESLVKAHAFKFNTFFRGRFSSNNAKLGSGEILKVENFNTIYDSVKAPSAAKKKAFMAKYKSTISVEHLLANYLNDKSSKAELKGVVRPLLKKVFEQYLYELKEIFFQHFLTKSFADKLNLDKTYTLNNINDIFTDTSKFAQLFIKDDMWSIKYLSGASSSDNVIFENISDSDLNTIKEFVAIIESQWSDFTLRDDSILEFLPAINTELTDELLDKLILIESSDDKEPEKFFALELETVNHYLIHSLLDANSVSDKTTIAKYVTV